MSDLYEEDIVLWSERQSELLRRRAAGELVNEAELDWPNIAEEIESLGNEQRFAVESLLVQAIVHRLKAEAWPACRDMETWLADSMRFRGDAASRFVSSMRQRIDLDRIYRRALRGPYPDRSMAWQRLPWRRFARSRWTGCLVRSRRSPSES
ncbi:MAG: DUF29 family protein [Acetobacteraceae bacterium]